MGNFVSQVANDQISKWEDAMRPWYLIPNGIALVAFIGGIVAVALMYRKDSDEETKPDKGGVIASVASIFVGLLVMIIMSIVLAIRHPRATAQRMVFDTVTSSVFGPR